MGWALRSHEPQEELQRLIILLTMGIWMSQSFGQGIALSFGLGMIAKSLGSVQCKLYRGTDLIVLPNCCLCSSALPGIRWHALWRLIDLRDLRERVQAV